MPHAGGGLPRTQRGEMRKATVAPRRWGSTPSMSAKAPTGKGCPTPVGVYLYQARRHSRRRRLPHAGGGLPAYPVAGCFSEQVAPRRWGSTSARPKDEEQQEDCPTPVGVYLKPPGGIAPETRLPHAGGGLLDGVSLTTSLEAVAPRQWGSTGFQERLRAKPGGCPTPVGVYLSVLGFRYFALGLPHAGGGLPTCPWPPER